ncbi:LPS export ABC transporter permease LptF [Paraferrimonas sp. SM1919]|uniref:LPS export ABC transporter permease LptF n=1 Tax=Paraferrimonas sp. SM1919 TaxID=2662263 RepID=UPI0013D17EFA|nr:LPS export ABC transporter permease LptF [Paraferrimonas sp. SM1919]
MILFKYLIKEVLKAQVTVLFVLLAIFLSENFVRVLSGASNGDFPAGLVATLIGLNLPWLAALIVPLSLFLGVLLAHGRMYAESEMTVLHAIGVSEWYVARVTSLLAIFNLALAFALSVYVAPWAQQTQMKVLEQAKNEAGLAVLSQGRFQQAANGKAVIFVEQINKDNTLENIFVANINDEEQNQKRNNLVFARGGKIIEGDSGSQMLTLADGTRYELSTFGLDHQVLQFSSYSMQIQAQQEEQQRLRLSAMPVDELLKLETPRANAEFHWRLGIPLSIPVLTLLAVPLARVNVRQGKFAKMAPAILLYLSYFGVLVAGRKALEDEVIPAYMGMWWVHLGGLMLAAFFLIKDRPIGVRLWSVVRTRGRK